MLEALALALKDQLPPDTAFIRFDPPWAGIGAETPSPALHGSFRRAGADIQPPDTVVIDLKPSEDDLLAAMKSKWRYNVRLADKKGVAVRRLDAEGLDAFYGLYEETSKRDRIAIHGRDYYAALFAHAAEYRFGKQELRLYVAEHADRPIAAIITLFRGEEATYLYGASSDSGRNLMPAYALQWRAMRDAREAGCTRYDLFGIPPQEDASHPMAGLYRFKTGFGGEVLHRAGSWDYAYRSATTAAFRLAEAFRKALRSARKARRKGRGAEE
jgi:lipid II:glycine glycyltransferase (peptidoglycan interpeptide bridge formation enzyme)